MTETARTEPLREVPEALDEVIALVAADAADAPAAYLQETIVPEGGE